MTTFATLPALTIWQPWASLIILGAKPYEFRSWPAPKRYQGQRIAIHAGARPVKRNEVVDLIVRLRSANAWRTALHGDIALAVLDRVAAGAIVLPLAHVLGTAVLGEPTRNPEIMKVFGGVLNDSDRDEHSNWAWPLTGITPLVPPVPAKGSQNFWPWRQELAA